MVDKVRANRVAQGLTLNPTTEEVLAYVRQTHPDASLVPFCDHYETDTQPKDCELCVCEDCGAWVGAREIARCGGLCESCLDKGED